MRRHHTKTKGDLGVLHAQLDLAQRGDIILLPQTEHAPFDLVAYLDGRFLRVQVKYRAAVNGVVTFPSTSWADRHGTHTSLIDKTSIDIMCIFCPDTGRCYYATALGSRPHSFTVITDPKRPNQVRPQRERLHRNPGSLWSFRDCEHRTCWNGYDPAQS